MRSRTALPYAFLLTAVALSSEAASIAITNPSFEDNAAAFTTYPGYVGANPAITGWAGSGPGGRGINGLPPNPVNPFANNAGAVPGRDHVVFLQNTGSQVSQTLSGFTPGQSYAIQFYESTRNQGGRTASIAMNIDGSPVFSTPQQGTVGGTNPYRFHHIDFVATSATHDLSFVHNGGSASDTTVLLDSIAAFAFDPFKQVVVQNPSFEAGGDSPGVGYLQAGGPNKLPGWTASGGNYGTNNIGQPFWNNGAAPDGDQVFFTQGQTLLSQTIDGLTPGTRYYLSFDYNSRSPNTTPDFDVLLDGATYSTFSATPTGANGNYGGIWNTATLGFNATGTSVDLGFQVLALPGGDRSLLLDNITLAIPEPSRALLLLGGAAVALLRRRRD